MNSEAKFREECLTETAECDQLAGLARSESTRGIMTLSATVWRKAEREMSAFSISESALATSAPPAVAPVACGQAFRSGPVPSIPRNA